jgi:hypothetical protein
MPVIICGSEDDVIQISGGGMVTPPGGTLDPAFTPRCVSITNQAAPGAFAEFLAPRTDVWLHFRMYQYSQGPFSWGDNCIWSVRDLAGTGVFVRCIKTGDAGPVVAQVQSAAGVWTNLGPTFVCAGAFDYDVRLRIGGAGVGRVDFYFGGTLWGSYEGATNAAGASVQRVYWGNPFGFGNPMAYVGEFMLFTGNESTVGRRLVTRVPSAVVGATAWAGAVGDVNESPKNGATLMTSSATGQLLRLAANGLPGSVVQVRALVLSADIAKGITGPQSAQFGVVTAGAVERLAAARVAPDALGLVQEVLDLDPDTGAVWTPAGAAADLAIKSA